MSRWFAIALLAVVGCGASSPSVPDVGSDAGAHRSDGGSPDDAGADDAGFEDAGPTASAPLPPAEPASVGVFTTSHACADCHANATASEAMRTLDGDPVAPSNLWRASMMANAARDPFFRASLSNEIRATPGAPETIQAICLGCHAPMGERAARASGGHATLALLHEQSPTGNLARDGVSCALCHQISAETLGEKASFDGNFVIGEERLIYGPHPSPYAGPMMSQVDYTPTESEHIRSAALCGSCHTLITDSLDADGNPTGGRLLEQTPYLEWRNSSYDNETRQPGPRAATCTGCHLPTTDAQGRTISTRIARSPEGSDYPIDARRPYGRHQIVGGNHIVPAMLRDNAEALGIQLPRAAFDEVLDAVNEQLTLRTAVLHLEWSGDELSVRVENRAGHKLPTAYPSRRVWLRVSARDGNGGLVFESGRYDGRGRLVDERGQVLASELAGGPIPPHLDRVRDATPALWSAVMADEEGRPTFTLLRGASFLRDNRILPHGWRPDHPDAAATAPAGVSNDPDFEGGEDTVHVTLPSTARTVDVQLLYQVISPRWADELLQHSTPEIVSFRAYWEEADVRPVRLAFARATRP